MQNLTDDQQLRLWLNLWKFADKELPSETNLMCFVVSKNKPEVDSSQPLDVKQEGGNGVPPTPKECGYPA